MAGKFGLFLVLLGIFAVVDVWAHGRPQQNGKMKMRRIDAGGLYAPGEGPDAAVETATEETENTDEDNTPEPLSGFQRYRHKPRKDRKKSQELQEQMRTMTVEERREFMRQRQEEHRGAGKRGHNGLQKERQRHHDGRHSRRHGGRHGGRRHGDENEPQVDRQENSRRWQEQKELADKMKELMEPKFSTGPALQWPWQVRQQASPDTVDNTVGQIGEEVAVGRKRRAIDPEPQMQPTRGNRGHKKANKKANKAEKKAEIVQFREEKREVLQNVLSEMGLTMEEFKQMNKQERRPIWEAVEQQLPEREPEEKTPKKGKGKKAAKKELKAKKAEMKQLRLNPEFVEQLQAIKGDESLTRKEKRVQKSQLKEDFKVITVAEDTTDAPVIATQQTK